MHERGLLIGGCIPQMEKEVVNCLYKALLGFGFLGGVDLQKNA